MQTQKPSRPTSVTVVAMLSFVTGIIFLIGGAALILKLNSTGIVLAFGTVHLPIGMLFLVAGTSVWNGKAWAWIFGVVLSSVSIIDDVVGFTVVSLPAEGVIGTIVVLVTGIVMLYSLSRHEVKAFFGTAHLIKKEHPPNSP